MRQAIINQWGKILGSAEAWEYHPHQVSRAVGGLNPLQTFVNSLSAGFSPMSASVSDPTAHKPLISSIRVLSRPTSAQNFGKTAGLPSRWSQTMQGFSASGDVYHVEH